MKKNIVCLICTISMVLTISIVKANQEVGVEKNGNITNYYAKKDPVRYAQSVADMSDTEKKKLYDYAMKNPDKVVPVTYIALADYIFKTNKQDALFWYFVGRIRATEDVSMCTDTSARQQIAYYPMLAENTMEYFSNNKDIASKLMAKAVAWDEAHPSRVNPKWACYHGMEIFMTGDVTTKPMSEYQKVQREYRNYVRESLKQKH